MKVFAERLKYERKMKGLTQYKLAALLNLPRSTYRSYELISKHNRQPSLEIVCEIAKVLEVSVDYLLGLED